MTRPSVLSVSALLALVLVLVLAAPAAAQPTTLRWARGMVTAVGTRAFTLQMRDQSIAITVDPAAGLPKVAEGSIVEVHYADSKNSHTAIEIFDDSQGAVVELSKKPGLSLRGVAASTKHSTLKLTLGTKTRRVELDKKTRLVDANGQTVATGTKAIAPLLATGENLIVKFTQEDDSFTTGDVMIAGSRDKALEVRRLK